MSDTGIRAGPVDDTAEDRWAAGHALNALLLSAAIDGIWDYDRHAAALECAGRMLRDSPTVVSELSITMRRWFDELNTLADRAVMSGRIEIADDIDASFGNLWGWQQRALHQLIRDRQFTAARARLRSIDDTEQYVQLLQRTVTFDDGGAELCDRFPAMDPHAHLWLLVDPDSSTSANLAVLCMRPNADELLAVAHTHIALQLNIADRACKTPESTARTGSRLNTAAYRDADDHVIDAIRSWLTGQCGEHADTAIALFDSWDGTVASLADTARSINQQGSPPD